MIWDNDLTWVITAVWLDITRVPALNGSSWLKSLFPKTRQIKTEQWWIGPVAYRTRQTFMLTTRKLAPSYTHVTALSNSYFFLNNVLWHQPHQSFCNYFMMHKQWLHLTRFDPIWPDLTRVSPESAPSQPRVSPESAPSQPRVSPESAPSQPRVSPESAPAPSQPRVSPESAPSQPRVSPESAPSQPRVSPESAPSQPRVSPESAPSQPRVSPESAPSQPRVSPESAPSQPRVSPESAPSQPRVSPESAPSQPRVSPESAPSQPRVSCIALTLHNFRLMTSPVLQTNRIIIYGR